MPNSPYNLPSMTMLRTFEAAARNGAFNGAASELNVTPGAVSHQIKALEKELGVALFLRGHRIVDLTEEGKALFDGLQESFQNIAQIVSGLRRRGQERHLLIGATTAMSTFWLTSQIMRFCQEHPDITINQHLSDARFKRPLSVDIAMEYCVEPPKEARLLRLFGDDLVPVCSPELAEKVAKMSLQDLASAPLIHMDAPDRNWTTWSRWFVDMGYQGSIARGRKVNNYAIALQIACEGGGIVLGWKKLVAPLLNRGELVCPSRFTAVAPGAFYLVVAGNNRNPATDVFFDWIHGAHENYSLEYKVIPS